LLQGQISIILLCVVFPEVKERPSTHGETNITNGGKPGGRQWSIEHTAKEAGLTPAQLGVLWCKDQPGVTAPLIGPQKVEHLEDLIPVLEKTLSEELREACDNLVPPGSAVANLHNTAGWMKEQLL
jgi:diketogulonate reductase-like aldo/keto reductase